MLDWVNEVRQALRGLRRARLFALLAGCTLALGMGANAAIFAVLRGAVLRPLPWREPEQLVRLWSSVPDRGLEFFSVSAPDYEDWRQQVHGLSALAAFERQRTVVLRAGAAEPREEQAARASADLFALLGVTPRQGRLFRADEDDARGAPVALITSSFWRDVLAADAHAIGRTITLDGVPYSIIGVLPESFLVPGNPARVWTPLGPVLAAGMTDRGNRFLRVFGRLDTGVSIEQATSELRALAVRLGQQYPGSNRAWSVTMRSLRRQVLGDTFGFAVWALLGVVTVVLLIACANVTNLLLGRAVTRRTEAAARLALGASRWRVVRHWLVEGAILGAGAGLAGLALAVWSIDLLRALHPSGVPRIEEIRVDGGVAAFTLLLSLAAGVLLAVAPALHATAGSASALLREAGRGLAGGRRQRLARNTLLVTQVALTVLLATGAGLLLRSFQRLLQVRPGFDASHVLTARVTLPAARYAEDRVVDFYRELVARAGALPGVRSAALVSSPPMGGVNAGLSFALAAGPPPEPGKAPDADFRAITPGYLGTLRIPLLQGRDFTEQDRDRGDAAIISQTMARQYWPDGAATGQQIRLGDLVRGPVFTIVGVAGDVRSQDLETPDVRPMLYLPHRGLPAMTLMLRTTGDPGTLADGVRATIRALDPDLAPGTIATQEQLLDAAYADRGFQLTLFAVFGGLALLIAAVGIYGVTACGVAERTAELGIRLALGAPTGQVLRMVLRESLALSLTGVVLGTATSLAAARVMATLLFHTDVHDPLAFSGVVVLLLLTALLAAWLPARRATRVDPILAVRLV